MLDDLSGCLFGFLPVRVQAGCVVVAVIAIGLVLLWAYYG